MNIVGLDNPQKRNRADALAKIEKLREKNPDDMELASHHLELYIQYLEFTQKDLSHLSDSKHYLEYLSDFEDELNYLELLLLEFPANGDRLDLACFNLNCGQFFQYITTERLKNNMSCDEQFSKATQYSEIGVAMLKDSTTPELGDLYAADYFEFLAECDAYFDSDAHLISRIQNLEKAILLLESFKELPVAKQITLERLLSLHVQACSEIINTWNILITAADKNFINAKMLALHDYLVPAKNLFEDCVEQYVNIFNQACEIGRGALHTILLNPKLTIKCDENMAYAENWLLEHALQEKISTLTKENADLRWKLEISEAFNESRPSPRESATQTDDLQTSDAKTQVELTIQDKGIDIKKIAEAKSSLAQERPRSPASSAPNVVLFSPRQPLQAKVNDSDDEFELIKTPSPRH